MEGLVTWIFDLFTNPNHKAVHKTLFSISFIVIILYVDNTLNFSTSYNNIRKYEQVQAINSILSDTTLSNEDKKLLKENRFQILTYKTLKEVVLEQFYSIDVNYNVPVGDPTHPATPIQEKETNIQRSYWIHFVTSSWTIVLCMIIFPVMSFFTSKSNLIGAILGIPILEVFLYMLSWFFAKVFSFIPIILNNVNYNYALNFVIHGVIVFILVYYTRKYDRLKKAEKDNL